jgi:pimeloyl-ACP methyl ester carboxylesterase
LRERGHEVYTPSLTGLGEREHLSNPQVNLSTHIQDVVNVIDFEGLHDIVLVGHSYGGMVVTGVVDRLYERISHLSTKTPSCPKTVSPVRTWATQATSAPDSKMAGKCREADRRLQPRRKQSALVSAAPCPSRLWKRRCA